MQSVQLGMKEYFVVDAHINKAIRPIHEHPATSVQNVSLCGSN